MKIPVDQITEAPKNVDFAERVEELNDIYEKSPARDFHFPEYLGVEMQYYRSGREIFFHGSLRGTVEGVCSRCLGSYSFGMNKTFDFILTPEPGGAGLKAGELSRDDLGLSFYASEELDLSPLIREQILLALPTRPLCAERCRGLCGTCGADLNVESCACVAATGDPRMAVFRTLKLNR